MDIIKYYEPRLDQATRRIERVLQQSGKVPKDLPGSDEALRALDSPALDPRVAQELREIAVYTVRRSA